MINMFYKEISINEMDEAHWTFISDKLINALKYLGGYPFAESLIYAIIDKEKKAIIFLPYHKIDRTDSRLRFVDPDYQLGVLQIINNY